MWKWNFEPHVQANDVSNGDRIQKTAGKTINGSRTLIPFDEALKLARSVGAEMDKLLKSQMLNQEKEYMRLMGPIERKDIPSFGEASRDGTQPVIIDMIHKALILWSDQEYNKLDDYLQSSGAGRNETFWRVAQALSNLLPLQSKEKQLLDGLLGRHSAGISETPSQREDKTLDEFILKK